MSVIKVNNITNRDGTSGPVIAGIVTVSSSSHFVVPTGNTFRRSVIEDVVDDGLVLYLDAGNDVSYPGSGTTWTDLSGNNNNGTLVNGVGYSASNGGALSFDGSDDWFSTTLSIGDANTSFSWGGFVKVNSSTSNNFFLFGNYTENNTTPFFAIAFNNSGDNTFIYIRDSTGGTEINSSNTNLDLSTWYYLMGVRDAGANQVKLYANGELVDTDTFAGSHNVKSTVNNFGGVKHLANYANCNIGTVHVYNRALSAAEISQNYNALRSRYSI